MSWECGFRWKDEDGNWRCDDGNCCDEDDMLECESAERIFQGDDDA